MDAFRSFDFDNNPQWKHYKDHLEVPAGKAVDWEKFKAKWYKRTVDPDFDVFSVQSGASSAPPPPPQASTTGRQGTTSTSTGAPQNGSKTAPTQPAAKGFLGRVLRFFASNSEERLFFLHLALLLFAVLHLQPIARVLAARSWGYFLQTAMLTHAYKVYLRLGAPQGLWPFSLQRLQAWLKPVTASTDFQYALVSMVFLSAKPLLLIMVPMVTLSVYHVFAYLSKNYGHTSLWARYGEGANTWLAANQQSALLYNAAAEIGGAFLVIISLLAPPRSFLLVFIYFQFLRMRFWSPDAATYHRMVWSQIDGKVGRYLDMVPALRVPIGYVQRWFLNANQR